MSNFNLIDNNRPMDLQNILLSSRDEETLYQRLSTSEIFMNLISAPLPIVDKSPILRNCIARFNPAPGSNSSTFSIQSIAAPLLNTAAKHLGQSTPATAYAVESALLKQGFSNLQSIPLEQLVRERELIAEYIKLNVITPSSIIALFQSNEIHSRPWSNALFLLFNALIPAAAEKALETTESDKLLIDIADIAKATYSQIPHEDLRTYLRRQERYGLPTPSHSKLLGTYLQLLDTVWKNNKEGAKLMMRGWLPNEATFLYNWWTTKSPSKNDPEILLELLCLPCYSINPYTPLAASKPVFEELSPEVKDQVITRYLQEENDALAFFAVKLIFWQAKINLWDRWFTLLNDEHWIRILNNLTITECYKIISYMCDLVPNNRFKAKPLPQYIKCLAALMLKAEPKGLKTENIRLIHKLADSISSWIDFPQIKSKIAAQLALLPIDPQLCKGQNLPLMFYYSKDFETTGVTFFNSVATDFNLQVTALSTALGLIARPKKFDKAFPFIQPFLHTESSLLRDGLFSAFVCYILPVLEDEENFNEANWMKAADFMFDLNPNGSSTERYNHHHRKPWLTKVFAQLVFLSDGLVQFSEQATEKQRRFFNIGMRLPLELQMILLHRWGGSGGQNISAQDSEPEFKFLAKILTSPSE